MFDMNSTDSSLANTVCLSIVVPIFNVSCFLGKCLDSLLMTEGIETTEIILVDDGSTDGSGKTADSYAEKFSFVSCFHKNNGGLSDARNFGLKHAHGKYVFFCDSDDKVIPEGFAKVIKAAENCNAEMILWDGITIDENDAAADGSYDNLCVHFGLDPEALISGIEVMSDQIKDHGRFVVTAWLRACRRDLLLANDLFFEKGLIHEDELWTPKVLLNSSRVRYLKEKVYCYRVRNDSIMGSYSKALEDHAKALVYIMNSLGSYYPEHINDSKQRRIIMSCWAETYIWMITGYCIHRFECRKDVPRFRLLCSVKGFKNKIKTMFMCLFGIRAYTAALNDFRSKKI